MTKQEFEERVNKKVSTTEYGKIEAVYNYHPAISDTKGKDQIAKLYNDIGFGVIEAMYPMAMMWSEKEQREFELRRQLNNIQRELEKYDEERRNAKKQWKI